MCHFCTINFNTHRAAVSGQGNTHKEARSAQGRDTNAARSAQGRDTNAAGQAGHSPAIRTDEERRGKTPTEGARDNDRGTAPNPRTREATEGAHPILFGIQPQVYHHNPHGDPIPADGNGNGGAE